MVFRLNRWSKNFRGAVFAGGQDLRTLVEKYKPYCIFGCKGDFNMKLLEITAFNKMSRMVGSFSNFY